VHSGQVPHERGLLTGVSPEREQPAVNRRLIPILAVVVAALALAACSSSKKSSSATLPPGTASSTTLAAVGTTLPSATTTPSFTSGPCSYLDAMTAPAYTGVTTTVTLDQAGPDVCIYRTDAGQVLALTVGTGPSLYTSADGTEFTLATIDKAKWNEGQKTLAVQDGNHSFVMQFGPAATVTKDLAGNAAQFIAGKMAASS